MPELPEVETVRLGLSEHIVGAKVTSVDIFDARSLKRHIAGPHDFVQTLTGAKIAGVVRRGKFLWMPLTLSGQKSTTLALVGHLGMSGQMLIRNRGAEPDKLTRVSIHLKSAAGENLEFRFVDQRLFGSLQLDELVQTSDAGHGGHAPDLEARAEELDWWNRIPSSARHIARDPLDPNFDLEQVLAKFKKKSSGIKRVLLDQGVLSGVGNIYADEALWRARVHYDHPANRLKGERARELMACVREILAAAVEAGGTSFDEQYKNVNGESGYFEVSLNAYGQTDSPCARCGTPIRREAWMNRGSHFCPKCQKRPR